MKNLFHIFLGVVFLMAFTLYVSANMEINSTSYSGFITQGSSGGNITNSSYSGDSASFYQQAIGYLDNLLFSGIHSFSFSVAELTGFVPSLSILKPENKTYITIINLPLNFTVNNQDYTWYNLDNGANTTVTGNTTFNTTNGLHTLYLFANNTYGNSSTNLTFTVNASQFTIYYSNYSDSTRGSSTDFNKSTYEDLQNLSGIILEKTTYGKISFNQEINLTNDSNPSDNVLNLDFYTNISSNHIGINSTALPNLNKTATLYLYNLTFSNPRVLKDTEVCSSEICTEINYSGGTFVFNVTQFTNYSAEETPGEAQPPTGSGGGGGSSTQEEEFILDKEQISVTLNPGQVITEEITITNTGSKVFSIRIDNLFTDFVAGGEDVIILNPGESKKIPFYILVKVGTIPDLYLGKIIISSDATKKEILVAIEVESEGILLDVRGEVLEEYRKVLPGEEILSEIRLFNLGGSDGRKDVLIEYIIRDYNNSEIVKETESLAIETQATFIKRIDIPSNVKIGNYVLYIRAIYDEKIASASDNFEVVSSKVTNREKIYIVIIIVLIIILSLIIYYRISKRGSSKKVKGVVSLRRIIKN